MLIFEGPDNSGKSTIANYISEKIGIPVNHFSGPPEDVEELKERIHFMMANHDKFIFDRIPLIGEDVYSSLRDNNLLDELENHNIIRKEFLALNPLIIYCRPRKALIMSTAHLPKSYDTPKHIDSIKQKEEELIDRYDEIMSNVKNFIPIWDYDYEVQSKESLAKVVIIELKFRNHYKGVL